MPANEVLELIALNLGLAVAGCAAAVRHFLARRSPGAIVNVSSPSSAAPGARSAAYATAKAAIEGLTGALTIEASFVNGAVVPIDGGRAALGLDPEAHELEAPPP